MRATKSMRTGVSALEVVLGLVVVSMLTIQLMGMLKASVNVWQKYSSQDPSIAAKHTIWLENNGVLNSIQKKLQQAALLQRVRTNEVEFLSFRTGTNERVFQDVAGIHWEHDGSTDLIAPHVDGLRFVEMARGANPLDGSLIQVELDTSGVSLQRSVWIHQPL